MNSEFNNKSITPNFAYEVDPIEAEELGAFIEDAIDFEDVIEAVEDES
ncbi:MAG: hypothetical protein GXZ15_04165 [Campylobacter sp.]|nr:hypothetical protein [Aliarcobacter butzleri]NLY04016.1 hypothetical protein [Campylobacter sp.]